LGVTIDKLTKLIYLLHVELSIHWVIFQTFQEGIPGKKAISWPIRCVCVLRGFYPVSFLGM